MPAAKKETGAASAQSTRKRKRLTLSEEQATADVAAADGAASDSKAESEQKPAAAAAPRRHRKTLTEKDKKQLEAAAAADAAAEDGQRPAKRRKTGSFELVEHGLWSGWKDIFFVGTEWNNYDLIFSQARWDFDHLEHELFEGELKDKKVFLFGQTEPQTIGSDNAVYMIPSIVAVVGDIPPPNKLGIKSVQMEKEEFVNLDDMKMSWTPLMPKAGRTPTQEYFIPGDTVKRPRIQVLHCNLRRTQLKHMKEEEVRKYEYCLPYFARPRDALNKDNYPTDVIGSVTIEGRGVSFEYDWSMDILDDTVDELCKEHEITDAVQKQTVKQAIQDQVNDAKQKIRDDLAKKKHELEGIPPHILDAMNNVKLCKFYPQNKDFDLAGNNLVSSFINRYYGRASAVMSTSKPQ